MNKDPTIKEVLLLCIKAIFSLNFALAMLATYLFGLALERIGIQEPYLSFITFGVGWYGG